MAKMKRLIAPILLCAGVIVMCLVCGGSTPVLFEDIHEELETIDASKIEVIIIDDETIQLEQLIKGDGLTYTWKVKNYIDGSVKSGGGNLSLEEYEVIQFYYEDLEQISFQSIVTYENTTYTSGTFTLDAEGNVIQDEAVASSITYESAVTREVSDVVALAYLAFVGCCVLLYYVVPKRAQWMVLLGASVIFYTLSGISYIIFILVSSCITFWTARKMSERNEVMKERLQNEVGMKAKKALKQEFQRGNKQYLVLALIGNLGVMAVLKYYSFVLSNINGLVNVTLPILSLIMPLGLSFYTFMLVAYTIDIYRGKYLAEKNFGRFFTFITFFPHVAQGPIARYDEVSCQLRTHHKMDIDQICFGCQRILWGFFVKLVLADRLAVLVNEVYDNYTEKSWLMLLIATLAYSIQIYADFYSSMEIAIGTAQLFGIQLRENFLRPYFATNMPEFWRRWHATLGSWFKEYVFYPISMSKRLMKWSVEVRKKYGANTARIIAAIPPIMGVWILTGLWHGASWKFVAWGMFHGTLILMSTAIPEQNIHNILHKIGIKTEVWYYKIFQMGKVFLLCTIGRVFFRADSLGVALQIFRNILTLDNPTSLLDFASIDLLTSDYIILGVSCGMLLLVSILQEKIGSVRELIGKRNVCIRWTIWIVLIGAILIFGVYGVGTTPVFLYEAF